MSYDIKEMFMLVANSTYLFGEPLMNRKMLSIFIAFALCLSFVLSAAAAEVPVRNEIQVKKIESFDFLVDFGMSSSKVKSAQEVMAKINRYIPDLTYQASMHSFSPAGLLKAYGPYNKSGMAADINDMFNKKVSGDSQTLGDALDFFDPLYTDFARPGAVVVFTDGDYGTGRDALNEAKVFYITQPNMCLHFVSFATSKEDQALIEEMASLNPCSSLANANDILNNDKTAEAFAEAVFWNYGVDESSHVLDTPKSTKFADSDLDFAPAVRIDDKTLVLSISFGFDSDKLDATTARVADMIARHLKSSNERLIIDGYTCNIGSAEYNMGLSIRRANNVRNYLINQGIASSRITAKGHGMNDPRYDNKTAEGRRQNRRVEFTFEE